MKEGWKYLPFEKSIVKVKKQKSIKSKDYKEEGQYPVVSQESLLISGYFDDASILYKHDTPVVIFGDHTQNVKYVDFDFIVGADGVHILSPIAEITPKFFYYQLKSIKLRNLGYARHYKLLKQESIGYPPLPEQERIVSLLDAEFAKIDAIKANAEEQLQDAKALFQSALKDYLTPKEGWEEKRFGTIYDVRDGTHDSPKYTETGFPLVTSKNLKKGLIDFSNIKYISEEDYNKINERSRVDIGDVLFAMIGTIGNPVLVADQPEYAIKNMALFKVPCNQSGKYLQYLLSSNLILDKFHSDAKGTTQKFVGLGYLRDFCFPIPNHIEQLEVVKKLEYIEQKINSLQSNFDTTVNYCNDLKQSILKDIFS